MLCDGLERHGQQCRQNVTRTRYVIDLPDVSNPSRLGMSVIHAGRKSGEGLRSQQYTSMFVEIWAFLLYKLLHIWRLDESSIYRMTPPWWEQYLSHESDLLNKLFFQ